jgi:FKBP-type peptidyl-prolyl cis-trans isomerase
MPSLPKVVKPSLILLCLSSLITAMACGSQPSSSSSAAPVSLATSEDSTLYALGLGIAGQMQGMFTETELAIIGRGLRDGVLGEEQLALDDFIPRMEPFMRGRREALNSKRQAAAVTYVADAAQQAGAVQTESGLVYIEEVAGTGPAPKVGDRISVHYTGMFTDGKVFDSSHRRGEPLPLQLGQGRVIKGWEEGLLLMKQGGKARLVIPPELGYGAGGNQGIPGNVALVFDVELVKIH